MIKTIEVRSLLTDKIKEIGIEDKLVSVFKVWYEEFIKKTNKEPTLIDVFYSGYVLSNPSVRELFRIKINEREKMQNDF